MLYGWHCGGDRFLAHVALLSALFTVRLLARCRLNNWKAKTRCCWCHRIRRVTCLPIQVMYAGDVEQELGILRLQQASPILKRFDQRLQLLHLIFRSCRWQKIDLTSALEVIHFGLTFCLGCRCTRHLRRIARGCLDCHGHSSHTISRRIHRLLYWLQLLDNWTSRRRSCGAFDSCLRLQSHFSSNGCRLVILDSLVDLDCDLGRCHLRRVRPFAAAGWSLEKGSSNRLQHLRLHRKVCC
mmetsp:Transcript_68218/g.163703  ORF Transcript_68218/g.163703 Transcript_68218/m.163703 type:complete len:240 (+) Transcript_68218:1327-2046(+)